MSDRNGTDAAFDQLYRDVILEHYRAPHGKEALPRVDARAEGVNPLCGDEVDVHLTVAPDGRIEGVQIGRAHV